MARKTGSNMLWPRNSRTERFSTRTANRTKGGMDASDYLSAIRTQFPKALTLQSIPTDEDLWRVENFPEFLSARRKMLAAELNAFLTGITQSPEPTAPTSIDDLIAD